MTWHVFRIERYDALIMKVAIEYTWMTRHGRLSLDDLFQAGRMGMCYAVTKFDPLRGIKLSTYGILWTRQYIQRMYSTQAAAVYIPQSSYNLMRKAGGCLPTSLRLDNSPADDDGVSFKERIPCKRPRPDADQDERELSRSLERILQDIEPRRAQVVRSVSEGKTYALIGREMGLSRERVRQLYEDGLERCRKHWLASDLKAHLEVA